MKVIQVAILFSYMVLSACSSAPQKSKHFLHRILLYNLHFRRPEKVGAQSWAVPGESEYESHPKPNSSFDCEPFKDLYKNMNLAAVRDCLKTANSTWAGKEILYRLYRETMPDLELEESDEGVPSCFMQLLKKIPVPREIFFQSNDEGQLSCYNARIPIVPEELLGIKAFLYKFKLRVSFPMKSLPSNDEETRFVLATWSMAPFYGEDKKGVFSKVVPTEICRACMGERNMFSDSDSLPPLWEF